MEVSVRGSLQACPSASRYLPGPHGLVGKLLKQGQLLQEVVNDLLAVHKGLPVTQGLGQLLSLILEIVNLQAALYHRKG